MNFRKIFSAVCWRVRWFFRGAPGSGLRCFCHVGGNVAMRVDGIVYFHSMSWVDTKTGQVWIEYY